MRCSVRSRVCRFFVVLRILINIDEAHPQLPEEVIN